MKRTKIADKIEYIEPGQTPFASTSAGIFIDGPARIFIDMNLEPEETKKLLDIEKPDMAVITHYHLDHSMWLNFAQERSDIELFVPEGEEKHLSNLDFFIENTMGKLSYSEEFKFMIENIIGYKELRSFNTYTEETQFSAGDGAIQCISAPGHSPSHSAFYFPDEKILFVGDIGIGPYGPWYGWLDCDLKKHVESMLRLRSIDARVLLTCHDGIISSDIDKEWDRCLGFVFSREEFMREGLDAGKSKDEIVELGLYFKSKVKTQEPLRTLQTIQDSIAYDLHFRILEEGGLRKYFPEIF